MIPRIVKDEVCVIYRSRRLRWITQTEALILRQPRVNKVYLCSGKLGEDHF